MSSDFRTEPLFESSSAVLIEAADPDTALIEWTEARRADLETLLDEHGAVLLRGFLNEPVSGLEGFLQLLSDTLLDYTYRSTPRTKVGGRVFTATEYPNDQRIPLHCEMSYTRDWPTKIAFQCVVPAESGGETPIADVEKVTARIGKTLVDELAERGVNYTRNYGLGVDVPWSTVFQTEKRVEVDAYCAAHGIEVEWLSEEHLRTSQTCQGTAEHPRSRKRLWFNQAHLFHVSSLGPAARDTLIEVFGIENLPRHAQFGDGAEIPEETLTRVAQAFEAESRSFDWRSGDIMLLDNMRYAHGRAPFKGVRKMLVAMADPYSAVATAPD